MVVCKFFMEGYCKFGGRCKFEHVDPYGGYNSPRGSDYSPERPQGTSILKAATSTFGSQDYSRTPHHSFGQPQQNNFSQHSFGQSPQHSFNQSPQHGFSTPQQSGFPQKQSGLKYNVQEIMQIVVKDITQVEKGGQWQLSCYSPLKELPNMPGLEDYSQEELRWECYKALQNGSLPLCQVIVQQLFGNVAKMNNDLKRKDTGYSIVDRWLRDSDRQKAIEQPAPAPVSPFGGSSAAGSAFGSPFFSSNEPQHQQQTQPAASSFSFSLPQQQLPTPQPFQQNSAFLSNQTSSVQFSNNQASSTPFFSNNQTSATVFSSRQSPPPFSNNSSAFTSPLSNSRTPAVDSRAYSTNENLTEAELNAFQADRFTLGSIPTKPPPRALCNL